MHYCHLEQGTQAKLLSLKLLLSGYFVTTTEKFSMIPTNQILFPQPIITYLLSWEHLYVTLHACGVYTCFYVCTYMFLCVHMCDGVCLWSPEVDAR